MTKMRNRLFFFLVFVLYYTCQVIANNQSMRMKISESNFTITTTDKNCSLMTAKIMQCEASSFSIRENEGLLIFKSSTDQNDYSFCYDISKCYGVFFNLNPYSECPYKVLLNGTMIMDGGRSNYVRFGDCSQCKGEDEVVLSNQNSESVDVNYTYLSKGVVNHGVVGAEQSVNFCIDPEDFNVLTVETTKPLSYEVEITQPLHYYLVKGKKVLSDYPIPMPKSKIFGKDSNRTMTSLWIHPIIGESNFAYILQSYDYLHKSFIKEGSYEMICIDVSNNCYNMTSNRMAHLSFFEYGKFVDDGVSSDYSFFGSCSKKCEYNQVLHSTVRGKDIISTISFISRMVDLQDLTTPHYSAACWLIYDDSRNLDASSPQLLQRYILALLFFSTKGLEWKNNWGYLTGKSECKCQRTLSKKSSFAKMFNYYFVQVTGME